MRCLLGASALIMLGACSGQNSADEATPSPAVATEAAPAETTAISEWQGTWTGPEGLFVTIGPADGSSVELEMQSDLDTLGTYRGTITAGGISFNRGGETLLLKPASGADTGLKYLADKTNCLMVKPGEGYCRDAAAL